MNKKDLEKLVQECISEVMSEGYDEFQRADKGSKGVAAKDKAEEDTYGAGYAAGEKAAKSRYKKLAEAFTFLKKKVASKAPRYGDESPEETARMKAAVNQSSYGDESPEEVARMKANLEKLRRGEEIDEIYNRLKEDGFGLGPKGLDTNDDLDEIEGKPKMTSDAQAIINIIEKQPMLVQKLSLISDRRELEDIFDYLITRLNPQFAKNAIGIRTAANNAVQKFAKDDKELNEDNLEVKSVAKNIYSVLTKNGVKTKLVASIPSAGSSGKSIGATLTGGSNEALVYYWDDPKTKLTTVEIHLSGNKEEVLNFEKKILSSFPSLEQYSRQEYATPQAFKLAFRVKEKTTAKGGIQELKKVLKK